MSDYAQPQVARQPIFDSALKVDAYELLFRSGVDGVLAAQHPEASTTGVVSTSLFGVGTDQLTGGKLGYVNFPRKLLVGGYAELLSPKAIGIEILDTVEPDSEVTAATIRLDDMGFRIAIDDARSDDPRLQLAANVDVAKIDFVETTAEDREQAAAEWSQHGVTLLGKRIESNSELEEARRLGCRLFQGYFFAEPVIVHGDQVTGSRAAHLRMMRLVTRPDIAIDKMEELIKSDVALSYKLLKYINSVVFGWKHEISSIHQALVLLGDREVRKWVALVSLTSLGADKPLELAVNSVTRGRMCESLATPLNAGKREADLFFTGILSHIDALSSQSMEAALTNVHVADDVRAALLGDDAGNLPATALAITTAYESADWDRVTRLCEECNIPEDAVTAAYRNAVEFGRELLNV